MSTYVLQKGRLLDFLMDEFNDQRVGLRAILPRGQLPPVRPPGRPSPPSGPAPRPGGIGRPGGAGRPGRGAGGGGGSWPARALAVAVGTGLLKLWSIKWYIPGAAGTYFVVCVVKRFVQTSAHDDSAALNASHFRIESADTEALLTAYVKEVLQRRALEDLDCSTFTTSYGPVAETAGHSVDYYCVEHFHLKIVNHVKCAMGGTPLNDSLKDAFGSLRNMLVWNARQGHRLTMELDEQKYCIMSRNGQAIGLFIDQELSTFGVWDCCNGNPDVSVVAARYEKLSHMAAKRLSNKNASRFDTISAGPEFIIIACDGICNLMENLNAVQFVYQGVRAGTELPPLCEVLLDGLLSSGSSATMVALFVQFKAPQLDEGSSVNV